MIRISAKYSTPLITPRNEGHPDIALILTHEIVATRWQDHHSVQLPFLSKATGADHDKTACRNCRSGCIRQDRYWRAVKRSPVRRAITLSPLPLYRLSAGTTGHRHRARGPRSHYTYRIHCIYTDTVRTQIILRNSGKEKPLKSVKISRAYLGAGVGFEPTTFRL